jgi:hypothetical protein
LDVETNRGQKTPGQMWMEKNMIHREKKLVTGESMIKPSKLVINTMRMDVD